MTTKHRTKLVHEGDYMAEVDIDLIESADGWSPGLTMEDALRLDEIRRALKAGDLKSVAGKARIFSLTPVQV